jgi:hypothetical protein
MPPTNRRSGGNQAAISNPPSTMPLPSSPSLSTRSPQFGLSPYLLLIYPTILALGSLYSTLSPPARSASHAGALTPGFASELNSHTTPQPVNYFASKRNLLNVYFVKIDWFWTTLAFALLAYTTYTAPKKEKGTSSARRWLQAALRYSIVTATWVGTTQWLLGPPLIDRSFTLTGGRCDALPAKIDDSGRPDFSAVATHIACKAVGGHWKGGHDISGHVFMLVLSSAFLILELYISDALSPHPHVSPKAAAAVAHDTTDEEKRELGGWESGTEATIRLWSRYFVWTIVGLDFWMFLMTAIWFHTWLEKLSGLLISGSCIWAVYFLPTLLPAWRAIVGPL